MLSAYVRRELELRIIGLPMTGVDQDHPETEIRFRKPNKTEDYAGLANYDETVANHLLSFLPVSSNVSGTRKGLIEPLFPNVFQFSHSNRWFRQAAYGIVRPELHLLHHI